MAIEKTKRLGHAHYDELDKRIIEFDKFMKEKFRIAIKDLDVLKKDGQEQTLKAK